MEPATHDDIWQNFLQYKRELASKVSELSTPAALTAGALELVGNLYYAAAMCRVHYARVRAQLPKDSEFGDMANYWKQYYNTTLGAGIAKEAVPHFYKACYLE
jgi:hypothetical protein